MMSFAGLRDRQTDTLEGPLQEVDILAFNPSLQALREDGRHAVNRALHLASDTDAQAARHARQQQYIDQLKADLPTPPLADEELDGAGRALHLAGETPEQAALRIQNQQKQDAIRALLLRDPQLSAAPAAHAHAAPDAHAHAAPAAAPAATAPAAHDEHDTAHAVDDHAPKKHLKPYQRVLDSTFVKFHWYNPLSYPAGLVRLGTKAIPSDKKQAEAEHTKKPWPPVPENWLARQIIANPVLPSSYPYWTLNIGRKYIASPIASVTKKAAKGYWKNTFDEPDNMFGKNIVARTGFGLARTAAWASLIVPPLGIATVAAFEGTNAVFKQPSVRKAAIKTAFYGRRAAWLTLSAASLGTLSIARYGAEKLQEKMHTTDPGDLTNKHWRYLPGTKPFWLAQQEYAGHLKPPTPHHTYKVVDPKKEGGGH